MTKQDHTLPPEVVSIARRIRSLPDGQHLVTITKKPGCRIELVILAGPAKVEHQKRPRRKPPLPLLPST